MSQSGVLRVELLLLLPSSHCQSGILRHTAIHKLLLWRLLLPVLLLRWLLLLEVRLLLLLLFLFDVEGLLGFLGRFTFLV
jgi:hypothetical protein